ncbi:MAG: hypothetical protein U0746_17170 [Gemmataceae bacterium]
MLISLTLAAFALATGQQPELPPVIRDYSKTMTYYYTAPDPALGPKILKELLKPENLDHAWFENREAVQLLMAAQLGDVATKKPKIVRVYEEAFDGAPLRGRRVVIRALMNCGDRDSVKRVDAWMANPRNADVKNELQALRKHLLDPERKHVRDRPARNPKELDLLWANYFVTGEYVPVSRILDVFDLPDAKENEVMKRVARWSLGSNLQQHPKLVELVQKHAKDRPDGSRKVIGEVIVTFPKGG